MGSKNSKPVYHRDFDKCPLKLLHLKTNFIKQCKKANTAEDQMNFVMKRLIFEIDHHILRSPLKASNIASKTAFNSDVHCNEGNVYFSKNDYQKALELYSRSIACAPIGSNGLGVAYANRSTVLRAMGKFADCISDVQRALSLDLPGPLRFELMMREVHCHRLLGHLERATLSFICAEEFVETTFRSTVDKAKALETLGSEKYDEAGPSNAASCLTASGSKPCVPDYGRNVDFPSASSAVTIEYSQKFGRHMCATRDINIGDVLAVEEPLCAVLEPSCWHTHCAHCLRRCLTLLPCDTCAWAMFCSEECKHLALDLYHRAECTVVIRYCFVTSNKCSMQMLLLIRLVATLGIQQLYNVLGTTTACPDPDDERAQRTQGFNTDGQFVPSIKALCSLTYHVQQPVQSVIKECYIALLVLKLFKVEININPISKFPSLIYKLLRILNSNVHRPFEMEVSGPRVAENIKLRNIALGLFTTGALVNHSCAPNASNSYFGRSKVLRASIPIKQGSQIFESYGPTWCEPKSLRQGYLKSDFNFDCECDACDSWPDKLPELSSFYQKDWPTQNWFQILFSLSQKLDSNEMLDATELEMFQGYLSTLSELGKWGTRTFQLTQELLDLFYWSLANYYSD